MGDWPRSAPVLFDEPFNGDLSAYTVDAGTGLSVTGGVLTATDTTQKRLRRAGSPFTDAKQLWKLHIGSAATSSFETDVMIKALDASNYLYVSMFGGVNAFGMGVGTVDAGVDAGTTIIANASTSGGASANTDYWAVTRIHGNKVGVSVFLDDPLAGIAVVPIVYRVVTLAGATATKYGSGISGHGGVRWFPAATSATLDDHIIVPSKPSPPFDRTGF